LILADALPFCGEESSSGDSVLIQGVECGFVSIPPHNIFLTSDLLPVSVGIESSLPFNGVHLLLDNDLAGNKVVVNQLLTGSPNLDEPFNFVEQDFPEYYPSNAVTRAMVK
jgi:hypothetical protein